MQKGRTLRFIVAFLSGLLANTTLVYADHFAAAGVKSEITDDTSVQFWFLRVASPTQDDPPEFRPVIPTQFECTVVHKDASTPFWLFASLKEIESIEVEEIKAAEPPHKKVSQIIMTGKVRSRLAFESGRGVRFLTEGANFQVIGVDVDIPGADSDTFELKFHYRMEGIGAQLHEAIPRLVDCEDAKDICTLKLAGKVGKGELEVHTASGE